MRHAGRIAAHPRSRSSFAVAALALAAGLVLTACDNDGSDGKESGPNRSSSSSSRPSGSSSSAPGPSTSTTPPATPPTSAAPPPGDPGTCGNQTEAIVAATNATDAQALNTRAGEFTVQGCKLAASSPIWAAAQIVGNPGVTIPRFTVVLQRIGALWNVMDVGESGHSGCDAPPEIRADLGLGC